MRGREGALGRATPEYKRSGGRDGRSYAKFLAQTDAARNRLSGRLTECSARDLLGFPPFEDPASQLEMNRLRSLIDWPFGLLALFCLVGSGCGRAKPKPQPPPAASTAVIPCDGGETRDPPHREARPAIQALRSNDYDTAGRLFQALLGAYPESSSLRVWLGDARLGQGTELSTQAALEAYNEASALEARGCKLRERESFFLAIGLIDVQLRQKQPAQALQKIEAAAQRWPDNAEIKYQRARAECALDQRDACFDDLQSALTLARSRVHERFTRSHATSNRLGERAAVQPEFDSLRKGPGFRALLASATTSDAGTSEDALAAP
jgi:tetratricopeptide (TPR) repeat protein